MYIVSNWPVESRGDLDWKSYSTDQALFNVSHFTPTYMYYHCSDNIGTHAAVAGRKRTVPKCVAPKRGPQIVLLRTCTS